MIDRPASLPIPPAPRAVPRLLAFVAGTVDACTFLALFGLFVAQVTGSFVTVVTQVVKNEPAAAIHLLALPLFFLAGVIIVVAARSVAGCGLALALGIEAVFLAGFMAAGLDAAPFARADAPSTLLASALGLLAMGVQSATVRLMLPGTPSTNVMTTNTSQLGIDVAHWLVALFSRSSQDRTAAARRVAVLAPDMGAFFAGSALGAAGFMAAGFWLLLVPIGILLGLAVWAAVHARH